MTSTLTADLLMCETESKIHIFFSCELTFWNYKHVFLFCFWLPSKDFSSSKRADL